MKPKIKKDRPEKRVVVKVSPNKVQKLSTWDLLKRAFSIWLDKMSRVKKPATNPQGMMPNTNLWKDITFLAIVVDDEVVDVMRVQPRMASILMHQPTFVEFDPAKGEHPQIGTKYKDGKLVFPSPDISPQKFDLGKQNEDNG